MFETVINPLAWWGLLAVAVPIIIHLINRLRYKKIDWAAMEFLLKAIQRHKRKLLMEQLLLLLLRCLLVLLVVLLIVRPLWFMGGTGSEAGAVHHHVIVLDDSFSMNDLDDPRRPEGMSAFRRGAQLLTDLAQAQASSNALHYWTVLTWSNPNVPEFGPSLTSEKTEGVRLTAETATRLKERLDDLKPGSLPSGPLTSLQQAVKHLDTVKEGRKHLHIVSDFRLPTWRNSGDEVFTLLGDLSKQGKVRVQMHDMAQPNRSISTGEVPPAHGNLSITNLVTRPRRTADAVAGLSDLPLKVVTPRLPFDVHVTVKNFGTAEHSKVKLVLRSDGVIKADRLIDRLSGGEERSIVFNMEYPVDETVGIKALTARLEDAEGRDHLAVDDVRYGFVELRSKVSVLVIDPDAHSNYSGTDWLYVSAALTGTSRTGIQADVITPRELATRRNLSPYSVIYLLNISGVGRSEGDLDEEGLKHLDRYVRGGGSLAYFLGPRTNVAIFNDRLYQKGQGIFPVPLMLRPDAEGRKSATYIDDEPDKDDYYAKLRFLKVHPAFPFSGEIAETFARFIHVNRYFRIDPQWKPGEGFDVLVQLMNRRPLQLYREQARSLAGELNAVAGEVPEDKLKQYVGKIFASVEDPEKKKSRKGELIEAISAALGEPAAANFWKDKKHAELQKKLREFLDLLQQGDPLVVEAPVTGGSRPGRVIAFLTPASPTPIQGKDYGWHDMATGDLAQFYFVPMMIGLQDHLSSLTRSSELTTSTLIQQQPLEVRLDKDRFHPQVELWYQTDGGTPPTKIDVINGEKVKPLYQPAAPEGSTAKEAERFEWLVNIKPIKGPGHYRLKFNQVSSATSPSDNAVKGEASINLDTAKIPEERPLAFNLDNREESDLTRLSEDQMREMLAEGISKGTAKTPLLEAREYVQGKTWFVINALESQAQEALQSQSWSEFSWVLLLFVGLLILEQYLAMKFSHHV
ncbi:MAG: BatA domain-containing protein [Gemmatales bacterium]